MIIAELKILFIFVSILTDQSVGSEMARRIKGFFYLPSTIQRWFNFRPGNGRPCARICQTEMATVSFWPLTKNCSKWKKVIKNLV